MVKVTFREVTIDKHTLFPHAVDSGTKGFLHDAIHDRGSYYRGWGICTHPTGI